MRAADLFTRNIYIRLADDGSFQWAIKYGHVPINRGSVRTREDDEPERELVLRPKQERNPGRQRTR
jgi:hypothetical protein